MRGCVLQLAALALRRQQASYLSERSAGMLSPRPPCKERCRTGLMHSQKCSQTKVPTAKPCWLLWPNVGPSQILNCHCLTCPDADIGVKTWLYVRVTISRFAAQWKQAVRA
eukprot:1156072-Pelagomonas_calceolata.AAC.2